MTHYQTLGVPPSARPEELHRAWKRLSVANHPDRSDGGNVESYNRAQEAWQILEFADKRKEYDALMYLRHGKCGKCKGAGTIQKSITFTSTKTVECVTCKGSGVNA